MKLTSEHMEIMDHTIRRAANVFYCGSSPAMKELVAAGLMVSVGKTSWCPDEYFRITADGRKAFREEANEIRHEIGISDGF